ncbi:hypothetical protein J3R30DRAFT_3715121 [Lentinula aciculospora]|uniref:REJ domain-containing protein n=1 Tax=Lentinula aciculospora TaxID=153920 RepID=A0A9W8ZVN6_9AGAR|nr:hypothetical protein J3R30DRAFT_3715121 [Lentinula aciculospora]
MADTGSSSSVLASDTSAAAVAPTSISSINTSITSQTTLSTVSSIPTTSSPTPSTSTPTTTTTSSVSSGDSSSTLLATTSSTFSTATTPLTSTSSTPSISSTTSTPSSTTIQVTTVSNSGTQTITVINSVTPASSPSTTSAASTISSSSNSINSFWSNKGAVAGTFTVVALICLAILIWAIMFIIRRRRANKFDRESEAAAAEAANATPPVFLDDDHDRPIYRHDYLSTGDIAGGYNGYEGGGYPHAVPSVSSHGTFNQPAMGLQTNENYPMAEFGSSLYPGASPYPSFMNPGQAPQPINHYDYGYAANELPSSPPMKTPRPTSEDFGVLDMQQQQQRFEGGGDIHNGTTHTTPSVSRGHSTTTSASHSQTGLSRNKSQGSRSLIDGYYSKAPSTNGGHDIVSPNSGESYAAHYQPGFSGMLKSASPRRGTFGYDETPPPLPNLFPGTIDDDEVVVSGDEGSQRKKILKVANE